MWSADGKEIYYISDRDNVMNLYVYNLTDKSTKQLTHYTDYDIKFPAIGKDRIVYENGGYIYKFDTRTKQAEKITVSIENDQIYSRPELKDVSNQIHSIDLSPNGERVLITARGDLYSIPAKEGITYNLTHSSDANDIAGNWSPDGTQIAYISDKTGEFNIWLRDAISGQERQLTQNLKTYIFDLLWSPDSQKILWNDKKNTLNITDITTGQTETIETSGLSPIHSYNWSPDSRYITYVLPQKP